MILIVQIQGIYLQPGMVPLTWEILEGSWVVSISLESQVDWGTIQTSPELQMVRPHTSSILVLCCIVAHATHMLEMGLCRVWPHNAYIPYLDGKGVHASHRTSQAILPCKFLT